MALHLNLGLNGLPKAISGLFYSLFVHFILSLVKWLITSWQTKTNKAQLCFIFIKVIGHIFKTIKYYLHTNLIKQSLSNKPLFGARKGSFFVEKASISLRGGKSSQYVNGPVIKISIFRCWLYFFLSLSSVIFVCGYFSSDLSRCSSNGFM